MRGPGLLSWYLEMPITGSVGLQLIFSSLERVTCAIDGETSTGGVYCMSEDIGGDDQVEIHPQKHDLVALAPGSEKETERPGGKELRDVGRFDDEVMEK